MVITAVGTPVTVATAAASSCEAPPRSSAAYTDFVLTYKSECATKKNYDRTFQDVTASVLVDKRNRLSVTTSTALAGAIASVKVNNKEFITSGGHGAAFQYAFHAWQKGKAATECYNPTQAGTRQDDAGQPPPYHGPSTSALYTMARSGSTIRTAVRPAMFVTLADTKPGWGDCLSADHQPKRVPFTMGLSPYWLKTKIELAPDHDAPELHRARLEHELERHGDGHRRLDGDRPVADPAHGDERWRARVGVVLQSWRDHGKWRVRELLAHLGRYYTPYATPART